MSLHLVSANLLCLMAAIGGLMFAAITLMFYKENTIGLPVKIVWFIWCLSMIRFGFDFSRPEKLSFREQFLICWLFGFFLVLTVLMFLHSCSGKGC
jgi:prolipoprotein diacylglyceryltransferase